MRRTFIFFSMLILSVSSLSGQEVLDGIVAIVGDEIILRTELIQMTQQYAIRMGIAGDDTEAL